MPMGNVARQFLSRGCQDESSIFLVLDQPVGSEPLNHVGHAGLGNLKGGGNIDHASITFRVNELENALEVIFHGSGTAECGTRIFARHDPSLKARLTIVKEIIAS